MNLHQQFPYMARRERRKPVDHGPDNLDFRKQLLKDILLMAAITAVCAFGIAAIMYYSVLGGW
jgi:hypothetical protein